jgi:hypothetical protein
MTKYIKMLTLLLAMLVPGTALATNGTLNNLKILEVTPYENGNILVTFDRMVCHSEFTLPGAPPPPPGDNTSMATIVADQEGKSQVFSAALAAMMAGKAVNVTFVDPTSMLQGPCRIAALAVRP